MQRQKYRSNQAQDCVQPEPEKYYRPPDMQDADTIGDQVPDEVSPPRSSNGELSAGDLDLERQ